MSVNITVQQLDALLPQTQCTQCGYPGCRPYAEAIAAGEAINRCVPGGPEVIQALAHLTGTPAIPLNPECGQTLPQRLLAFIREEDCIGCTKCIQACPVDAIVGAAGWMHTVIAADCTGCGLCVPPCPVDCIVMLDSGHARLPSDAEAHYWRRLHERHLLRRLRQKSAPLSAHSPTPPPLIPNEQAKQTVAAALARTELKKFLQKNPEPIEQNALLLWKEKKTALETALRATESSGTLSPTPFTPHSGQ